jgi:hypothetical protein
MPCSCCEYTAFGIHCCPYPYICCDCHDPKARERSEMYTGVRDGVQHAAIGQD